LKRNPAGTQSRAAKGWPPAASVQRVHIPKGDEKETSRRPGQFGIPTLRPLVQRIWQKWLNRRSWKTALT
jgi:hypothetical protein